MLGVTVAFMLGSACGYFLATLMSMSAKTERDHQWWTQMQQLIDQRDEAREAYKHMERDYSELRSRFAQVREH